MSVNSGRNIVEIARAHGVEGEKGDGNDINEVISKAKLAIERQKIANHFFWNSYIQMVRALWANWDDQLGYRKIGELALWMKRCPIKLYEQYLLDQQILLNKVNSVNEIESELGEKSKLANFPKQDALFENVYA